MYSVSSDDTIKPDVTECLWNSVFKTLQNWRYAHGSLHVNHANTTNQPHVPMDTTHVGRHTNLTTDDALPENRFKNQKARWRISPRQFVVLSTNLCKSRVFHRRFMKSYCSPSTTPPPLLGFDVSRSKNNGYSCSRNGVIIKTTNYDYYT